MSNNDTPPTTDSSRNKIIVFTILAVLTIAAYVQFGDSLTFESLAERETELRELKAQNLGLVLAGAFLIYVTVAGLSLPGAAVLSLVYAWYFGFWTSLPLVSFASTLGAMLSFLASRYLFRDAIQSRFSGRLRQVNESLERDGPFFLFSVRLIPAIPYFLVNLLMGLTPIKPRTFWWVSQIGMLPGTAVYLFAGSSVPSISVLAERGTGGIFTPQIWLAFALLATFPFIARTLMQLFRKSDNVAATP